MFNRLSGIASLLLLLAPVIGSAQLQNPMKNITGKILDKKTGQPIQGGGRVWVFYGTVTEPVTNSKINSSTGEFGFILDPSTEYRFRVISPRYYITDISYKTPEEFEYEDISKDLPIEPIPIGATLFTGRLFDPGSSELKESADLSKIAELLTRERGVTVTIAIKPDILAKVQAPVKPTRKPRKKKGRNVTDTVATPPPPPPVIDLVGQAKDRIAAVKTFFKGKGISTTRLDFKAENAVEIPAATKPSAYPTNVLITIRSIEPYEDDD